jgi:hypothetical protein
MTKRTFKVGDRVKWGAGDQAGDKGTVTRIFASEWGDPRFEVTWDDDEVIDYRDCGRNELPQDQRVRRT